MHPDIPYVYLVRTEWGMSVFTSLELAQARRTFLLEEWKRMGLSPVVDITRLVLN